MAGVDGILKVGIDDSYFYNSVKSAFGRAEKIGFSFNAKSFSQPLGRITADVGRFTDSLDAANQRVLAFGASASVIAGFTRGMYELATATVEVEKAFLDINAVFGLTGRELAKFKGQIFDVARGTAQTFESTAKAALEFSRQGLGVTETLERIKQAQILARLSGLDSAKAVESLTAVLNAYKKEGLDAATVVNKLVAVDTKFAVSSRDLVEALSRVGSTAQDVGVDFDSLIALVTTAQQVTARGGPVIGNALKSIFTRLNRPAVLDQLESFGIKVRDLQGDALAADQILQNIGTGFDSLSKAQKAVVAELSAGVFQINQLRAIVGELGRSYNTYVNALEVAKTATNEATQRNELLNKSLGAVLQNFKTTATEIGSIMGNLTFSDPLKKLFNSDTLKGITKQFQNIGKDGLDTGDKIGATIAEGILKGIGNVLTSSGGIIIGGALLKIIGKVAFTAFKDLGNILTIRTKEQETLRGLNVVLAQSTDLEQRRFLAAKSVAEQEQVVLSILNRQLAVINALKVRDNGVIQGFTPQTIKTLRGAGKSAAGGYIPNLVAQETNAIRKGTGGASPSAKPVIIPNFNFGGGQRGTVVANTSEWVVPNYANGGSAIFNPDMAKSMGLPSNAKKINAAGGFVPNFISSYPPPNLLTAKGSTSLSQFFKAIGPDYKKGFFNILRQDPKLARFIVKSLDRARPEAQRDFYGAIGGKNVQYTPSSYGLDTTGLLDLSKSPTELRKNIEAMFARFGMSFPFAEGYIPNLASTTLYRGIASLNKISIDGLSKSSSKHFQDKDPINSFEDLMMYFGVSRSSTKPGVIPFSRSKSVGAEFAEYNPKSGFNKLVEPEGNYIEPSSISHVSRLGGSSTPNRPSAKAFIEGDIPESRIYKDPKKLKRVIDRLGFKKFFSILNQGNVGIDNKALIEYFQDRELQGKLSGVESLVLGELFSYMGEQEVSFFQKIPTKNRQFSVVPNQIGRADGYIPNFAPNRNQLTTLFRGNFHNNLVGSKVGATRSLENFPTEKIKSFDDLMYYMYESRKDTQPGIIPTSRSFNQALTFSNIKPGDKLKSAPDSIFGTGGSTLITRNIKEKNIFKDPQRLEKLFNRVGMKGILKLNQSVGGLGIDSSVLEKYFYRQGNTLKRDVIRSFANEQEVSLLDQIFGARIFSKAAKGFLPDGLGDALAREQAAGLAPSQIYVDTDPRVKHAGNPFGLLVANKKDEPIGGFQGVNRAIKSGINPKRAGSLARGYVPNFAEGDMFSFSELGLRSSKGRFISQKTITDLDRAFAEWTANIQAGQKNQAAATKKNINTLNLNTRSIAAVKDVFDAQKTAIEKAAKLAEKAAIEQANAATKAAAEQDKLAQIQSAQAARHFDAQTAPVFMYGKSPSPIRGKTSTAAEDRWAAYTAPGQMGEPDMSSLKRSFPGITKIEQSLGKSLTTLNNNTLLRMISNMGGLGLKEDQGLYRRGAIRVLRERSGLNESAATKDDSGNLRVSRSRVHAVTLLGKAETFSQEFERTVKGLIDSGTGLGKAYIQASQQLLDGGAKTRQLAKIQDSLIYGLADYERNSKMAAAAAAAEAQAIKSKIASDKSQARGYNNRVIGLQNINNVLATGGFDALSGGRGGQQSILKGVFRKQAIQELGLDPRGLRGNKQALAAVETLVTQKVNLARGPADQRDVLEQLKKQTRIFGNYDKTASAIIGKGNYTATQQQEIKGAAAGLSQQRAQRVQNFGLTAAFALPLLGGLIEAAAGPLEGGTSKAKGIGAISGATQGVGIGATLGSLLGPVGTIIGGTLGGAIGALTGYVGKATKSFEELAMATQIVESKNAKLLDGMVQYATAQAGINEAIQQGAKSDRIQQMQKNQAASISALPRDVQLQLAKAGSNVDKLQDLISDFNARANEERLSSQTVESAAKLRGQPTNENINSFITTLLSRVGESTTLNTGTLEKAIATPKIAQTTIGEEIQASDLNPFIKAAALTELSNTNSLNTVATKEDNSALLDALKELLAQSKLTAEQQKEVLTQLEKSSRETLEKVAKGLSKEISEGGAIAAINKINDQFNSSIKNLTVEFNRGLAGLKEVQAFDAANFEFSQRMRSSNFQAYLGSGMLNSRQLVSAQGTEMMRNAQREASFQRGQAVTSAGADFLNIIGKERATQKLGDTSIAKQLENAVTADQLESIIRQMYKGDESYSSKEALELRKVVQVLREIENATNRNVELTANEIAIMETQSKLETQNRVLQGSIYNPDTIAGIGMVSTNARAKGRSDIQRANSQLELSRAFDSLGFAQGENTIGYQRDLSAISARYTLSGVSSKLLRRNVGTDEESLRGASDEMIASGDKVLREAGERLANTLDALNINVEEEIKKLRDNDPTASIENLRRAGQLTTGESASFIQIRNTADNTKTANSLLETLIRVTENKEDVAEIRAESVKLEGLEKELKAETEKPEEKQSTRLIDEISNKIKEAETKRGEIQARYDARNKPATKAPESTTGKNQVEAKLSDEDKRTQIANTQAQRENSVVVAEGTSAQRQNTEASKENTSATNTSTNRIQDGNTLPTVTVNTKRDPVQSGTQGIGAQFGQGFEDYFERAGKQLQDFNQLAQGVAESLDRNLGNAFGDFVTGAKKGKDAFRDFVIAVLNDAARAMASQAVTGLLSSFLGGFGGGSNRGGAITKYRGGNIPRFASGGKVPALLTGGEYVFDPATARSLGPSFLSQLNNGTLPMNAIGGGKGLNSYGMVRGGSGLRDDVPASLHPGSYVIRKSAVNKYGEGVLGSFNSGGRVQKKWFAGALLGAVTGAGLGYATGGKKGAIIGGIGGGILGGVAQNQGWLKGIGIDKVGGAAAKAGAGNPSNMSSIMEGVSGGGSSAAGEAAAKAAMGPIQSALLQAGLAGGLGVATQLLSKDGSVSEDEYKSWTPEEIERERARLERAQQITIETNLQQQRFAYLNDAGSLTSFGSAPATRRFAGGGPVSPLTSLIPRGFADGGMVTDAPAPQRLFNGGPVSNIASPIAFADGGNVGPLDYNNAPSFASDSGSSDSVRPMAMAAPVININVSVTNNGGTISSQKSESGEEDDENPFADKEFVQEISDFVEGKVYEILTDESRNGGMLKQSR